MRIFKVLGNPINHSLSPIIHNFFANQFNLHIDYQKELISLEDLVFENYVKNFFNQGGTGLNITLPFKERAYNLSNVQHANAKYAKAANTLWYEHGNIHCDNTDGIGLVTDIKSFTCLTNKNILILGAGGASRGVIYPISLEQPKKIFIANRTLNKAQNLVQDFTFKNLNAISLDDLNQNICNFDIIINATSIGMNEDAQFDLKHNFHSNTFTYDMIYNKFSPFKQWAINHNLSFKDGKGMLINQALESFYIWNKLRPTAKGLVL